MISSDMCLPGPQKTGVGVGVGGEFPAHPIFDLTSCSRAKIW
jgi:hypothetical protein